MKNYGIIMAGGGGTRFWPLSRQSQPKQLLNLSGKELMINETIDRVSTVIPTNDIFIVTNKVQVDKMKDATSSRILENHILAEPLARNTAACIGYAAMEILKKYGDGIMCIFPSDHFIKDTKEFSSVLEKAIEVAQNDKLVTIGITPTFPSTGYGYIKFNKSEENVAKTVLEFKEKPEYSMAKQYVDSGSYAWNSGMFIWKASVILDKFKQYLPSVYDCLVSIGCSMNTENEREVIDEIYPVIESISIDYGIMEKAEDVKVISGDFGWNDVGSWDNLGVLYQSDENGNIKNGIQINIDTKDCISYTNGKLIATVGVENLIIVQTEDAVLVCNKDRAQDVKKVVDELKRQKKNEYL